MKTPFLSLRNYYIRHATHEKDEELIFEEEVAEMKMQPYFDRETNGHGSCYLPEEKEMSAAGAETLERGFDGVMRPCRVLSKNRIQPLLEWQDVPRHLQFNPYVLTGYRRLLSFQDCLHSLFYLHNETVNILTHGIPIVYILAMVPGLLPWEGRPGVRFLAWCHLMGALAPWCGSFVYHLFMNHSHGAMLYRRLLQLDMLGIWVSQSFGALPMVTATVYCSPFVLKYSVILFYCALCIWGLYKAMTAWSPWQRRLCFLLPFVMRIGLAALRAVRLGGGDPASMRHVVLQDAVSVIGGLIGAMNIPERWFPGTFDYCFNSHNIMHILVVSAVYSMHQVTVQDLTWMEQTKCHSPEYQPEQWKDL